MILFPSLFIYICLFVCLFVFKDISLFSYHVSQFRFIHFFSHVTLFSQFGFHTRFFSNDSFPQVTPFESFVYFHLFFFLLQTSFVYFCDLLLFRSMVVVFFLLFFFHDSFVFTRESFPAIHLFTRVLNIIILTFVFLVSCIYIHA